MGKIRQITCPDACPFERGAMGADAVPSPRGALVGLAPTNSKPPKLKYETL